MNLVKSSQSYLEVAENWKEILCVFIPGAESERSNMNHVFSVCDISILHTFALLLFKNNFFVEGNIWYYFELN